MTNRFRYTPEQIEFLNAGYQAMHVRDLTRAFNKTFGTEKTDGMIEAALKKRKIKCGRSHKYRLIQRLRIFTPEQARFLRNNYTGNSIEYLTRLFNTIYKTDMRESQIKAFVKNRGITSGRTGRFEPGHKPWNTGTKGKGLTGRNITSFKKGNVPPNRKPLASERIDSKDGYTLIKVAEPDPHTGFPTRYKHKHVHIWEQANGPVPEGMILAFRDGDKTNTALENLMLISRAELLRLNKHGYKDSPDVLKPSVLALAKLEAKTFAASGRQNDGS